MKKKEKRISKTKTRDAFNLDDFHGACYKGQSDVFKNYMRRSVDIEMLDGWGRTALHYACNGGHLKIVKKLVEKMSNIDLSDNEGHTPLFEACANMRSDIINFLLQTGRVDPYKKFTIGIFWMGKMDSDFDGSPKTLPILMLKYKKPRVVCIFIKNKCIDIDEKILKGKTLFEVACIKGYYEIADSLIANNTVDVKKQFPSGLTPFETAFEYRQVDVLESLIPFQSLDVIRRFRVRCGLSNLSIFFGNHFRKRIEDIIFILKMSHSRPSSLWSKLPIEILETIMTFVLQKSFQFNKH